MYEVDFERIAEIIDVIKKDLGFIESENIKSVDVFVVSRKDYLAVSMAIFTIQNKLIELGEELIESLDKGIYPKKYYEVPKILLDEKVIDIKMFKKFDSFIQYRNEIAHEYEGISENEIFWCVKNLDFVKDFIKIVKKRLFV